MNPVFNGMPATEREFRVPKAAGGFWPGRIICGGACRDNYSRIVIYDQPPKGQGSPVKLQRSAMESFRTAEQTLGFEILLTGSWRSCADQTKLWRQDSSRYAAPNTTAHPRGLAIDVDQNQSKAKLTKIHAALISRGWHQARADEPWHYSFGIQV